MTQTELSPPTKEQLRGYLLLQSTEVVRRQVELRPKDSQYPLTLVRCLERDQLQSARPPGCWCLGLGTKDPTPRYDEGEDHRIWGPLFCECPEGQALKASCRAEFRKERDELLWETSGIPLRFRDFRVRTSPLAKTDPKLIETLLRASGSFFLWGDYGTGKTGLAVGLAWLELDFDGISPLFRSVPDLLSSLRSTYGRSEGPTEQQIIDKYTGAGLLILDDMGAEQVKNTGWVEDRLYQIINKRHGEERNTIFTSNLSPLELGAKIGERIVWRILEMCGPDNVIEVKGPNLRDVKHG